MGDIEATIDKLRALTDGAGDDFKTTVPSSDIATLIAEIERLRVRPQCTCTPAQIATGHASVCILRVADQLRMHIAELEVENKRLRENVLAAEIRGLCRFAWWADGIQYVGTCGTTLAQAIDAAKKGPGK